MLKPDIRLIVFDEQPFIVPNAAIHMNREINEGYKIERQKDLLPLTACIANGFEKSGYFMELIAKKLSVPVEAILDYDLYLFDPQPGAFCGLSDEFFSVGKIDNLGMAYASLAALTAENRPTPYIKAACIFDNEEVGSATVQEPFFSRYVKTDFIRSMFPRYKHL